MSNKKFVYNFDIDCLNIVSQNEEINLDECKFVNITCDELYVMRVSGICSSDNELIETTVEQYNKAINNYCYEMDISKEEMQVYDFTFVCDEYIIYETYHKFGSDLCSFCLYRISSSDLLT